MRLLGVELRRFHVRRMLIAAFVIGVAIVGLTVAIVYVTAQPLTAEQLAQAEQDYQQQLEYWEQEGPTQIAECKESEAAEREASGDDTIDYGCDQMTAPQREWFIPEPPALADTLTGVVTALTFALGFLALLAGTTFTAAELSSRAITTWLTFEPRRVRVFASKVAAAAIGVLLPATVLLGLAVAGVMAAFGLRGIDATMSSAETTAVVHSNLRLAVLVVVVGAVGAALGILLRHTAAVLGVAIGWGILVEQIVPALAPRLTPWFVLPNVGAWVEGSRAYFVYTCTPTSDGTECEYLERTITLAHGGIYLSVAAVVVVAVSLLVFRRRDQG